MTDQKPKEYGENDQITVGTVEKTVICPHCQNSVKVIVEATMSAQQLFELQKHTKINVKEMVK